MVILRRLKIPKKRTTSSRKKSIVLYGKDGDCHVWYYIRNNKMVLSIRILCRMFNVYYNKCYTLDYGKIRNVFSYMVTKQMIK